MNNLLHKYQDIFNDPSMVTKSLNTELIINKIKEHKTPIGFAIVLVILKNIHGQIFSPPKNLKHIPHYNFWTYFNRLIKGVPYGHIQEELTVPLYREKKRGEMYLSRGLLGWTVMISNPEDAKTFFLKADLFQKAEAPFKEGTMMKDYVRNDNLAIVSDKHVWKKQRMTFNPAFKKSMPVRLFAEYTHRVFDVIDNSIESSIDITSLMERFTLDIIGKAGFDFEFNSLKEKNNEWVDTYRAIKNGTEEPLFALFPILETKFLFLFPHRKQLKVLVKKFYSMLNGVIDHKREILKNQKSKIEEAEKDLLTLMLEGELSGEKVLSDSELTSNLNIFFIAGHDTTANTLATAIYYLAKNQDIQERARQEAISVLGDDSVNVFPTAEQIRQLVYINQIMKETLRINGPAMESSSRVTTEDTELSGTFIPKNTAVMANMYNIHHNANVWKNVNTFDPDRFGPNGEAENLEREGFSWVPFGNGPRICIGMNFSLAEQRVMLSTICKLELLKIIIVKEYKYISLYYKNS
ncbi:unnamed protein product [Cunninghamella blakesleeana]